MPPRATRLHRPSRRQALAALGAAVLAGSTSLAQAQAWPSGQITLEVPFAAGSGTDSAARTVAQKLSARVGELPFALAVHPSAPARNVAELIAHVKANPGKLSYATPNSTSLVAMETIKRLGGGQDKLSALG